MAKLSMVLTGDKEINEGLKTLSGSEAKQAIRKSSREALRPMLNAARAAVPRRTGRLKKAVKLRTLKRSRTRVGARVTTGIDGNDFTGKAFYGGFLEYGWKTGARRGTAQRVANRRMRQLRSEARAAGGLGKRGTAWRTRQEAYFAREAARAGAQAKPRRQIEGKRHLKRAADANKEACLTIYRQSTRAWIKKLSKGK